MDTSQSIRIKNVKHSKKIVFSLFQKRMDVQKLLAACEILDGWGYCLDAMIPLEQYKMHQSMFQQLYTHGLSAYDGDIQINVSDIVKAASTRSILIVDEYITYGFMQTSILKLKLRDLEIGQENTKCEIYVYTGILENSPEMNVPRYLTSSRMQMIHVEKGIKPVQQPQDMINHQSGYSIKFLVQQLLRKYNVAFLTNWSLSAYLVTEALTLESYKRSLLDIMAEQTGKRFQNISLMAFGQFVQDGTPQNLQNLKMFYKLLQSGQLNKALSPQSLKYLLQIGPVVRRVVTVVLKGFPDIHIVEHKVYQEDLKHDVQK